MRSRPEQTGTVLIYAVVLLLGCQLIGEVISRGFSLPAPGPVVGLLILLAALSMFGPRFGATTGSINDSALGRVAATLLGSFGLFFVPATVGVVQTIDVIARYGVGLAVAIVLSTVLTLVVTVWAFVFVAKLVGGSRADKSR